MHLSLPAVKCPDTLLLLWNQVNRVRPFVLKLRGDRQPERQGEEEGGNCPGSSVPIQQMVEILS